MSAVDKNATQLDFQNHTLLAETALASAFKAQMPEVKHIMVSINGDEGAIDFVHRLGNSTVEPRCLFQEFRH